MYHIKGDIRPENKRRNDNGKNLNWFSNTGLDEILVDQETAHYHTRYVVYDEGVIKKSSDEDMAWAPVVSLLQGIIHLENLIYDCRSQFPPSLYSTLHEQHPRCRLHHLTFRFRTLLRGAPCPYEMELAASPCLYKVKLASAWRDSDGEDDFNKEALMELVAGLAPNLKEAIILDFRAEMPGRMRTRPRKSWYGLPGFVNKAVGSLTSLSLKGDTNLIGLKPPQVLQKWAIRTDLACLQTLILGENVRNSNKFSLSGETMEWVSQNCSFPHLRTLSVYLTRDDAFYEKPHYSENEISFFENFESLEDLTIHGPIDFRIMNAILTHHGPSLRKLSIHISEDHALTYNRRERRDITMEFSKDLILQIQARCPGLEEVTLPIKRNKSSASEAELYTCFAKMKSLRSLFLILDCSQWRVNRDATYDPKFDGQDEKILESDPWLRRGGVKETFINCAVNEALVCSICEAVSQRKSGRKLERLRLWTKGGGDYSSGCSYDGTIYGAVGWASQYLSRSWLIERDPREDRQGFSVRELGRHARELDDLDVERVSRTEPGEVFRDIWPCKEGSRDWRDDWSSFPLQI